MRDYRELIGREIVSYELSHDRDTLSVTCSDGAVGVFEVDGDCCSYTWIESLDAPNNLLGTVQSVSDINMPDLGNIETAFRSTVEEVKYYGLRIETSNGVCVMDYRNDSNGYYGGSVTFNLCKSIA